MQDPIETPITSDQYKILLVAEIERLEQDFLARLNAVMKHPEGGDWEMCDFTSVSFKAQAEANLEDMINS